MRGRRLLGLAMTAFLMTAMTGCGEAPKQAAVTEEVKLLEPVGLSGSGEAAAYRNLYDAQVYSATVVPYVEEYGFEEDVVLDRICAFPGEAVSRGEALAYSSTENLDKQIEELHMFGFVLPSRPSLCAPKNYSSESFLPQSLAKHARVTELV